MADIPISDVDGAGSQFVTEGIVYENITSGQTGSLISLPEVSGKYYKIFLFASNSTSSQSGISLIVDGVTVEDTRILADSSNPNTNDGLSFAVCRSYSNSIVSINKGLYNEITCKSFEITKNAGNTT